MCKVYILKSMLCEVVENLIMLRIIYKNLVIDAKQSHNFHVYTKYRLLRTPYL